MSKFRVNKNIAIALCFFWVQGTAAFADDLHVYDGSRQYTVPGQSSSDLKESFLKATRLLQQKQALEILAEQNPDVRPVDTKTLTQIGNASAPPVIPSAILNDSATKTYNWMLANQAQSPLGILKSYPQDSGQVNQGFTYDEAVAGIMLVKQNDIASAQKIFDFYNSQWDGTGFWTVYNTQSVGGAKIEFQKIMGPNAWMALFAVNYYKSTGDANALTLAVNIGRWISSLPHSGGGVAMGTNNPGGNPNYGQIYSIENNLDYYALLNLLSTKAPLQSDRNLFMTESTNLKQWFQATTYDSASGLFKRGPSNNIDDMTLSLDTNTWAISAIGVSGLKTLMNFSDQQLDDFVGRVETNFAVQSNGSFGGNILTAKGFDFAGAQNAQLIQNQGLSRPGIKWVEGTGQMILVYKQLADYYQSAGDAVKSAKYQARAAYFESLDSVNLTSDGQSYFYTDSPGTKIFWDVAFFNAAPGPAVPATAWMYFSLNAVNPFNPYTSAKISQPLNFSASTAAAAPANLKLNINLDLTATLLLGQKAYLGVFDPATLIVSVSNVLGGGANVQSENWELGLDETFASGQPAYSLASFTKLVRYSDASLYNYSYGFSTDGFLVSDLYYCSAGTNKQLSTRDYMYTNVNGSVLVDTVSSANYLNNLFSYGSRLDYNYDVSGSISSIFVTMETRDNPLLRVLQTHEYLFGPGGAVDVIYLGNQTLAVS